MYTTARSGAGDECLKRLLVIYTAKIVADDKKHSCEGHVLIQFSLAFRGSAQVVASFKTIEP